MQPMSPGACPCHDGRATSQSPKWLSPWSWTTGEGPGSNFSWLTEIPSQQGSVIQGTRQSVISLPLVSRTMGYIARYLIINARVIAKDEVATNGPWDKRVKVVFPSLNLSWEIHQSLVNCHEECQVSRVLERQVEDVPRHLSKTFSLTDKLLSDHRQQPNQMTIHIRRPSEEQGHNEGMRKPDFGAYNI